MAPDTIRVYRLATGKVEVVDFRRYVEVVTALEWPSWMPRAAVAAGAVAVKQYGWKKTLEGAHRPGFVTRDGRCYDVVDGTRDQLYKPERRTPNATIRSVVAETWDITIWKGDRFITTGYRSGSKVSCGRDADGYRLYAKSVADCARQGKSREQIQLIYYGPDVTIRDGATSVRQPSAAPRSTPAVTPKPTPKPTTRPRPKAQPAPTPDPTPSPAQFATPAPTPDPVIDQLVDVLSAPATDGSIEEPDEWLELVISAAEQVAETLLAAQVLVLELVGIDDSGLSALSP